MISEVRRRILVTGANGFIGTALVRHLAAAGYAVRAAARNRQATPSGPDIDFAEIPNLTDVEWGPLLEDVDGVVHLAAIAHRDSIAEVAYDRTIRLATVRLASACEQLRINRLIYISSIGAQTGSAADEVITEDTPPQPVSAYDRAKLQAEEAVRASGCVYTILRPVLVYGPGVKGNMGRLVRLADSPWPLPFGCLHNKRSFLALDNLVDAISFCLASDQALNDLFVVADEESIAVAEMLALMRRAVGRTPRLFAVPRSLLARLVQSAGPRLWDRIGRELIVNPAKLLAIGWRPPVNIRIGLKTMMGGGLR